MLWAWATESASAACVCADMKMVLLSWNLDPDERKPPRRRPQPRRTAKRGLRRTSPLAQSRTTASRTVRPSASRSPAADPAARYATRRHRPPASAAALDPSSHPLPADEASVPPLLLLLRDTISPLLPMDGFWTSSQAASRRWASPDDVGLTIFWHRHGCTVADYTV